MHSTKQTVLFAALLFAPACLASDADFSGHWEGAFRSPNDQFPFVIDLVDSPKGVSGMIGTGENAPGLPMKVRVKDRSVTFFARTDQEFVGQLSEDGQSIMGEHSFAGYQLPFTLTRAGAGKIVTVPTSPAIPGVFEGSWEGTLAVQQLRLRVVLTMQNVRDGATATVVSLDEGEMEVPAMVTVDDGSKVTVNLPAVKGSFSGTLAGGAKEILGTYKIGDLAVPVTLRLAGR